jgi:nicotinamide mononucleotide (NMN) deamidase PncC
MSSMERSLHHLIEALHASGRRCVVAVTGGGHQAAALLLNVPGASRTVLEVVVPYSEPALVEYLGGRPAQFCSADTSRAMARRAHDRGRWLAGGEAVVGIGSTASLATDRPKRGEHRFHVSIHGTEFVKTWSLVLTKGARDRAGEEAVLDAVLLNTLAEACGVSERVEAALLSGEQVEVEASPAPDPVAAFCRGELPVLHVAVDGRMSGGASPPAVLVPGAFNPLHHGHLALAETAERLAGAPTAFELSIANVDKPPLALDEVRRRISQFAWRVPLWLTRAPTFVEKARLFPGTCFVVGADTAERIVSPRYYGGSEASLRAALEEMRRLGCRFLVAGRVDPAGRFQTVADLSLPAAHCDLFAPIPESDFHVDCSSTALRQEVAAPRPEV